MSHILVEATSLVGAVRILCFIPYCGGWSSLSHILIELVETHCFTLLCQIDDTPLFRLPTGAFNAAYLISLLKLLPPVIFYFLCKLFDPTLLLADDNRKVNKIRLRAMALPIMSQAPNRLCIASPAYYFQKRFSPLNCM